MRGFSIKRFAEEALSRLLGQQLAGRTREFFRNLSITGRAALWSGALGVASSALIGRWLGPTEFGRYHVINSLSQFLVIPLTLGVHTALTQAIPSSDNRVRTIRSGLPLLAAGFAGSLSVYVLALPIFSSLLRLEPATFLLATGLAAALGLRYVADSILRGQSLFKAGARLEVLAASSAFFLLLMFIGRGQESASVYITVLILGAALYGTAGLVLMRGYLGWHISPETKKLFFYGIFMLLISGGQMFMQQADRLVLHYLRGDTVVGIYSAYLSGAMFATVFLFSIINYVLLPMGSAMNDIATVYRRLHRHRFQIVFGIALLASSVSYLFIRILGRSYPLELSWVLLAGLQAGMFFYANLLLVLAFSRGRKFLQRVLKYVLAAAAIFLAAAIAFTELWGVAGMFAALIAAYGFLAVAISRELKYNTVMSI